MADIFSAQSAAERSALQRPAKGLFWLAATILFGTALYAFAGQCWTALKLVVHGLAAWHAHHLGWAGVAITLFFVGEYARRRSVAGARMREAQAHPENVEAIEHAQATVRALAEWLTQRQTRLIQVLAVVYTFALLGAFATLATEFFAASVSPVPSEALYTILKTLFSALLPLALTVFLRSGLMLQSILGLATPSEDAGHKLPQSRLPWVSDSDGYGLRVNAARLAGELVSLQRDRDAYECVAILADATRTLNAFETGRRGARRFKNEDVYAECVKGLDGVMSDTMSRDAFVRHLLDTVPGMTPGLAERLVTKPLRG